MQKNSKVPSAILICFIIAFILQGALKLGGVFIFEKALDWQIFVVIDSSRVLQAIYYSIIVAIIVYCLSFSLTSKPYSKKWYHYVIIIVASAGFTTFRLNDLDYRIEILCDICLYIVIPFVINMTTEKQDRMLEASLFNVLLTLSIQIGLYFCYLGLTYWSSLLSSICIQNIIYLPASTNFLIQFEKYIGLIAFMLAVNNLVKRTKKMIKPIDIASDEAKEKELERVKNKDAKTNA